MAWSVLSACNFYLFPVILSHPRWPISKMALVGPSLVTVGVKSSDPRDSANDQKYLPWADLLRQIPRLCPASPPPNILNTFESQCYYCYKRFENTYFYILCPVYTAFYINLSQCCRQVGRNVRKLHVWIVWMALCRISM